MKKAPDEPYPSAKARVTMSVSRGLYEKLQGFAGDEWDMRFVGDTLISWFLDQTTDDFKVCLMNRRRISSDALRSAFCQVLQQYTAQVCGGPVPGDLLSDAEEGITRLTTEPSRARTASRRDSVRSQ